MEFYFRFQFGPFHRNRHASMHQDASRCQALSTSVHPWQSYDVVSNFMMSAATAQFYFRFRIRWRTSYQNVSRYQQTKFRRNISFSISGWDITISALEKQTSAILKLYFRFQFRPYHRNWYVILRQANQNRTTYGGKKTSYRFSIWRSSSVLGLLQISRGPQT